MRQSYVKLAGDDMARLSKSALPPGSVFMSYTDFATLRAEMQTLTPRNLLFVVECELEPVQLQELDADEAFVVIFGRENSGKEQFYCIARSEDTAFAVAKVTELVSNLGGTNITASQVH